MRCFQRGNFKGIAQSAGCSTAYVRNLVAGLHPGASFALSEKLVVAAKMEGVETELLDWMLPIESQNPAFVEYRKGGLK